jgi:hypothetical protein
LPSYIVTDQNALTGGKCPLSKRQRVLVLAAVEGLAARCPCGPRSISRFRFPAAAGSISNLVKTSKVVWIHVFKFTGGRDGGSNRR